MGKGSGGHRGRQHLAGMLSAGLVLHSHHHASVAPWVPLPVQTPEQAQGVARLWADMGPSERPALAGFVLVWGLVYDSVEEHSCRMRALGQDPTPLARSLVQQARQAAGRRRAACPAPPLLLRQASPSRRTPACPCRGALVKAPASSHWMPCTALMPPPPPLQVRQHLCRRILLGVQAMQQARCLTPSVKATLRRFLHLTSAAAGGAGASPRSSEAAAAAGLGAGPSESDAFAGLGSLPLRHILELYAYLAMLLGCSFSPPAVLVPELQVGCRAGQGVYGGHVGGERGRRCFACPYHWRALWSRAGVLLGLRLESRRKCPSFHGLYLS